MGQQGRANQATRYAHVRARIVLHEKTERRRWIETNWKKEEKYLMKRKKNHSGNLSHEMKKSRNQKDQDVRLTQVVDFPLVPITL